MVGNNNCHMQRALEFIKSYFTISLNYHNFPARYVHKGKWTPLVLTTNLRRKEKSLKNISYVILKCPHLCSCPLHACQCSLSDYWSKEVAVVPIGLIGIWGFCSSEGSGELPSSPQRGVHLLFSFRVQFYLLLRQGSQVWTNVHQQFLNFFSCQISPDMEICFTE